MFLAHTMEVLDQEHYDYFYGPWWNQKTEREPSPDEFIEAAFAIWNHTNRNIAGTTLYRRFHSYFGVDVELCSGLWLWIFDVLPDSASYFHLLWALLFLKTYSSYEVLSGLVGCDEKTYRKWVWIFLVAIADLEQDVVSLVRNFSHCEYLFSLVVSFLCSFSNFSFLYSIDKVGEPFC